MNIEVKELRKRSQKSRGCLITIACIGFACSVVIWNIGSSFKDYTAVHIGGFAGLILLVWFPISAVIIGSHIESIRIEAGSNQHPYLTSSLLVAIVSFVTSLPLTFFVNFALQPYVKISYTLQYFLIFVLVYTICGALAGLVLAILARFLFHLERNSVIEMKNAEIISKRRLRRLVLTLIVAPILFTVYGILMIVLSMRSPALTMFISAQVFLMCLSFIAAFLATMALTDARQWQYIDSQPWIAALSASVYSGVLGTYLFLNVTRAMSFSNVEWAYCLIGQPVIGLVIMQFLYGFALERYLNRSTI